MLSYISRLQCRWFGHDYVWSDVAGVCLRYDCEEVHWLKPPIKTPLEQVGELLEKMRNHYDKYEYFPVPWLYFRKVFESHTPTKQATLLKYFLDTPICQAAHFEETNYE